MQGCCSWFLLCLSNTVLNRVMKNENFTNIENLSEIEVHKLCPLKENKKECLVLVKLDFPAQLVQWVWLNSVGKAGCHCLCGPQSRLCFHRNSAVDVVATRPQVKQQLNILAIVSGFESKTSSKFVSGPAMRMRRTIGHLEPSKFF